MKVNYENKIGIMIKKNNLYLKYSLLQLMI
jgi:hypothetical protein